MSDWRTCKEFACAWPGVGFLHFSPPTLEPEKVLIRGEVYERKWLVQFLERALSELKLQPQPVDEPTASTIETVDE